MSSADKNSRRKKVLSAVSFVLAAVVFLFALAVFFISIDAKKNNKPAVIFGYSFLTVLTDSMTPEIGVGDLVVMKQCDMGEVKENQNIVFVSKSGLLKGQRIIHKVVKIGADADGLYFRTQGVKQGAPVDEEFVRLDNFVGVEVWHSGFLGGIVNFFGKLENWLLLIVAAVAIPIAVKQIINIKKYYKQRKLKDEDDDAQ